MFRHRKHFFSFAPSSKMVVSAEVPDTNKKGSFMIRKEIDYSDPELSKAMPSREDTDLQNLLSAGILPQQVSNSSPTSAIFMQDNAEQVLKVLETRINDDVQPSEPSSDIVDNVEPLEENN